MLARTCSTFALARPLCGKCQTPLSLIDWGTKHFEPGWPKAAVCGLLLRNLRAALLKVSLFLGNPVLRASRESSRTCRRSKGFLLVPRLLASILPPAINKPE